MVTNPPPAESVVSREASWQELAIVLMTSESSVCLSSGSSSDLRLAEEPCGVNGEGAAGGDPGGGNAEQHHGESDAE
jgi:hypothetical protein